MDTYQGDATVLVGDATYDVTADLRSETEQLTVETFGSTSTMDGLTSWGGSLTVPDDEMVWAIHDAREARLRLPSGCEGTFLGGDSTYGSGNLKIKGSGSAPF